MGFDTEKCPVCSHSASVYLYDHGEWADIDCEYCGGKFKVSRTALYILFDRSQFPDWQLKLSYWINKNSGTEPLIIDQYQLPIILQSVELPGLPEQVDNLMVFLGNKAGKIPNKFIIIPCDRLIPIIGAYDVENVQYVANYLQNQGLITHKGFSVGAQYPDTITSQIPSFNAQLTYMGWEKYGELIKPSSSGKTVFMAMDYQNKSLAKIFPENIVYAVRDCGFEIQLLRDVLKAGSIDDQLRVQIRSAKFLIVDLSDDNHGAYWEAGIAEGLGKPVIYLCEKDKFDKFKTHFDTNHLATVIWHEDTITEDMNKLKAIIRNTFPKEALLEDVAK